MAVVYPHLQTLTGLTPTWNFAYGEWAYIDSPAGNVAVTLSNVPSPGGGVMHFKQDGTGNRTLTIDGTGITVNPVAGSVTRVELSYNGSNYVFSSTVNLPTVVEFTGTNAPAAPASGVTIFSRNRGNRNLISQIDSDGAINEMQAAIYSRKISIFAALAGLSTVSGLGFNSNASGTATARIPAITNYYTMQARLGYVSAAGAGSSAGIRAATEFVYRDNGFFAAFRFGIASVGTTPRGFIGLYAGAFTNANYSTLIHIAGIAWDSGETNFRFIHNDGAGSATKIDLGANFPSNTANTDFYEVRLWAKGGTSEIGYSIERLNTGHLAEGTVTTDLPGGTSGMLPLVTINNGATAEALGIDIAQVYVETY